MRALAALGTVVGLLLPVGTLQSQVTDVGLTHLALDLRIDYETATLSGVAGLTVHNHGTSPVEDLAFQLGRLLSVTGVAAHGTPLPYTSDVVRYADWPEFQVLATWVELPTPLLPGATMTLEIRYHGTVVGYTETGMSYVRDSISPDFTLIRSDALSFPVLGEPSLEALRSQPLRDFTFAGSVTLPQGDLRVATAGEVDHTDTSQGARTWRFRSTGPAPFLLLAIAPYEVIENDDLRIFVLPGDIPGARRIRQAVTDANTVYSSWFGPRPNSGRITIMEIPDGWGSQASLNGGIIQTADAFRSASDLPQLYHELAHLWHPADTEQPADRWNEGFASFLQWRMAEVRDGASLPNRMKGLVERIRNQSDDVPPMSQYGETRSTDLAYRIGAVFFYTLFATIGENKFDRCMTELVGTYRDTGITSSEFASSVSDCGPGAERVVDEWFHTAEGVNRLKRGQTLDELIEGYRSETQNPLT